jgi:hypothetical protein
MTEQNETFRDPSPEEHWDDLVANPWIWFDSAWVLKDCAMILGERFVADLLAKTPPEGKVTEGMPPIAFGPVFQMLAGYALENVLKAIVIAREPNIVSDKRQWERLTSAQGHNLLWLCDLAKVSLEEPSRQFLEQLTDATFWIGRYPVTRRRDEMKRWKHSNSTDPDHFLRLYDRFTVILQNATK